MVVTNDPALFERAARFHDLGGVRPAHAAMLEKQSSNWFVGANYRMNEFTGGVLLAQMRKIDRIISGVRNAAKRVYDGIADMSDIDCGSARTLRANSGQACSWASRERMNATVRRCA